MDFTLYVVYITLLKYELPVKEILRRWDNTQNIRDYSNSALRLPAVHSQHIEIQEFFIRLIMRARRAGVLGDTIYVRHSGPGVDHKDIISFLIRHARADVNISMRERLRAYAWHYYRIVQGFSPRHIVSTMIDKVIGK